MDQLLEITCHETMGRMLDWTLLFPIRDFGVKVDFHHDRLSRWRNVVASVAEFLKSKEYH
jgi:hypothetical protein